MCLAAYPISAARKGDTGGENRISNPDWVKLCVELNCAPNQNTKFPSATINSVRDRQLQAQGFVYLLSSILRAVWYKVILNGSYVCFSQRCIWMAFSLSLLRAFWYKEILRRLCFFFFTASFWDGFLNSGLFGTR